ncbi:MAG: SDR family NAD(P)-dependent oxidoreductase [Paludibacteraceae bacterium]|nr:SDR family NAD(P)-dependent oxidoreductase [Paludibacteraceae bacterium]
MSWALITGASSGIGLRYARALARDYHYNICLVSNQENELKEAAKQISEDYAVETATLYINLAEQDAAERVYAFCAEKKMEIEVLVNNAGILIFNPFCSTPMGKIETLVMLHVVTMTKLCRLIGEDMQARKKGYILNMSSMTAWMCMPGIQCYNASKGYVLSFSRALWHEMQPFGVHVLAVTPGSTDTGLLPFGEGFAKFLRIMRITMPPERLVNRALHLLMKSRRKRCMPGGWNYIIVPIINHLPDWVIRTAMRQLKGVFKDIPV